MSISIKVSECAAIRELFVLYGKKGTFTLEEYVSVGTVFKTLTDLLKDETNPDAQVSIEKKDALFVYNTMTLGSQRTPVEVQNYKTIGHLFDLFSDLLKETDEETKSGN